MSDTEMDVRIYELGYWFVPTIPEDGIETSVTELKNKLSAKGANIFAEEAPYLREISYEMKKVINNQNNYFTEGYFGWMKIELDPSQAVGLTKELELDPSIIRSLLIQTVRENTVYTKRPATFKREEEEEAVEEAPTEDEAIDVSGDIVEEVEKSEEE